MTCQLHLSCIAGKKEDEDQSKKEEDAALAPHDYIVQNSPENVRFSIEQKFLVEMPKDFFDFWDCCSSINNENPEGKAELSFCFFKIHFSCSDYVSPCMSGENVKIGSGTERNYHSNV